MKHLKKGLFLFLSVAFITNTSAQWGKNKKIVGNGNVTTKTVSTGEYDVIKALGSMDFILVDGNEGSITVTTDDNLHDYITIETDGDELIIKKKEGVNLRTKKGIKIEIPIRDISEATLTGSGDLYGKTKIKATNFTTKLTGSGDVRLEVDASNVYAKVTGSGDMSLRGSASTFELLLTGSGDYDGKDLKANNTEVTVSGSGDASVYAKKSIKARVNGSGDIEYYGNPSNKDTKVNGSGDIDGN